MNHREGRFETERVRWEPSSAVCGDWVMLEEKSHLTLYSHLCMARAPGLFSKLPLLNWKSWGEGRTGQTEALIRRVGWPHSAKAHCIPCGAWSPALAWSNLFRGYFPPETLELNGFSTPSSLPTSYLCPLTALQLPQAGQKWKGPAPLGQE